MEALWEAQQAPRARPGGIVYRRLEQGRVESGVVVYIVGPDRDTGDYTYTVWWKLPHGRVEECTGSDLSKQGDIHTDDAVCGPRRFPTEEVPHSSVRDVLDYYMDWTIRAGEQEFCQQVERVCGVRNTTRYGLVELGYRRRADETRLGFWKLVEPA